MKKVIFSIALLVSSGNLFSQSENTTPEKKTTYGFQLGTGYSSILNNNLIPVNYSVKAGLTAKVGILVEHKLTKSYSLLPKAELSFNDFNFKNKLTNTNYSFNPITINLMLHTSRNFNKLKYKPYIYLGPNVSIPVLDKSEINYFTSSKPSVAIDLGIGLNFKKEFFILSPELKYSYGYLNVRNIEGYPKCNFHSISLVFNFKD